jgi:uncharacterized protein YdeI (BOF family)
LGEYHSRIHSEPANTSNDISNNNNDDLNAPSSDIDVAVPISEAEATLHVTRDKIPAVFAVAVAVTNNIKFTDRSHTINNVIEYADALIFKLSTINIHSARQLYLAVEDRHQVINNKLSQTGQSKLNIDTINLLRNISWKSSNFTENQSICAYNDNIVMIGEDDWINFDDHSGEIRVDLCAKFTLYNWDGQTLGDRLFPP